MVAASTSTSTWPGPGAGAWNSTSSKTSAGSPIAVICNLCMTTLRYALGLVLFDDVKGAQGPPELHQFAAVAQAAYSHRREAEFADQLVEICAGGVVVSGVEHDLAAVGVARISRQVTGVHRVERLDDRCTGQMAGSPFAAGFLAQVDIAAVNRCVFGELVGGVDHDPPAPIRHHVNKFRHAQEWQRQNDQIGAGRLLNGHRLGRVAEVSHQVSQAVGAAAVADVQRYLCGDQVMCQRLCDRPRADESHCLKHGYAPFEQ